jgi:fructokinase
MRFGVDLGGTKIEIAALDAARRVVLRERIPSPAESYTAIVEAIGALVERAEARLGVQASVGIGTPGVISRASGLMKNCNTVVLNGQPLGDDVQRRLGRAVRFANDANCFALAEAVDGAAAGARVVFGVILGTGVGGGVVVDGRVLDGANGIAGEWGHNPLPLPHGDDLPLPPCYCGRHGCIETYLSGPGFAALHARTETQRNAEARRIVERARDGDAACRASLDAYIERLARALATVVNVLDPDVIVLGGGLSNVDELYEQVPRRWAAHVFSDTIDTRLMRNRLGDSAGVVGAALLWP